jgi:hypothetical protein
MSFGAELAGFSAAARRLPQLAETVLIANLQEVQDNAVALVPDADRMIVSRSGMFPAGTESVDRTVAISHAVVAEALKDKPSQKTAFQMKVGFDVRSDALLTLFCDFTAEALAAHLAGDVQAVVLDDRTDCLVLKERYPDRLKTISKAEILPTLWACDACVLGDDQGMIPECLTRGTIPVVSSALKDDVVDLESTLASGTGIVFAASQDPTHLIGGLSRLTAAFHRKDAFKALVLRLPGYAMTWNRVAAYTVALIEEVKMENS